MSLFAKRKIVTIGTLILIQCLTFGLLSCGEANLPQKTVQDYSHALNSHNVDSLMSLYDDEIVFSIPGLMMNLSGTSDLRGVAEYDSVLNTTIVLSELSVTGDTVFCSIKETNEWMNVVGMSSAFYPRAKFVVKEGKITHIEADLADSSLTSFRRVLGSFLPWAKQFHPNDLDSLMPDGIFQFGRANGILYLELLKEWKRTSQ